MHAWTAERLALHTELGLGEVASFESSSGSLFIGSLSQTPAMEQLCASPLCSEQLLDELAFLGQELGQPIELAELESASFNESLRSDELVAAYSTASFQDDRLQQEELVAAYSRHELSTVRA